MIALFPRNYAEHRPTAMWLILICVVWMTTPCSQADTGVGRRIAESYRVGGFSEVELIQFTFNVHANGRQISRRWVWEPESDRVTHTQTVDGNDSTVVYQRPVSPKDTVLSKIDHMFVNDQYWLLFPFHLIWDQRVTIIDRGTHSTPIAGLPATQIEVTYQADIGYTPSDMYRLYVDSSTGHIVEWSYHAGGKEEGRPATWSMPVNVGPIAVSLEHSGPPATGFRLFFTDVAVRLKGQDGLTYPEP